MSPAAQDLTWLQSIIENISDVIAIVDVNGQPTYVSPSVERILGYEPDEFLRVPFLHRVHPQDRARLSTDMKQLARRGACAAVEYRIEHANRSWRLMEVVARNLLDHPQIEGVVLSMRDITERKRMEQEVAQLYRLTSLGRLAAQVAHEFNNVLMGIQPMVDILRKRAGHEAWALKAIDSIHASIGRGKRITTDILRYARPAQLSAHPVRVEDVIRQAEQELRPMLQRENITLDVHWSQPAFVHADPAQLAQVLINLALNARDAMPAGGMLEISATLAHAGDLGSVQRFIHFRVRDTGEGISSEHLPYIFEPLFTTKRTGTGLGLSVVHQIVAAHGGRISVESTPGSGATFDVFIPAATQSESAEDPKAGEERLDSMRILLVDDDDLVTEALQISLEEEGMMVRVVTRGAEVVSAIESFHPDLILLDLTLPDADGRTLYARIAERFDIPVIFSTGHAAELDVASLLDQPRTAFLMKPYTTDELLATIRGMLPR